MHSYIFNNNEIWAIKYVFCWVYLVEFSIFATDVLRGSILEMFFFLWGDGCSTWGEIYFVLKLSELAVNF